VCPKVVDVYHYGDVPTSERLPTRVSKNICANFFDGSILKTYLEMENVKPQVLSQAGWGIRLSYSELKTYLNRIHSDCIRMYNVFNIITYNVRYLHLCHISIASYQRSIITQIIPICTILYIRIPTPFSAHSTPLDTHRSCIKYGGKIYELVRTYAAIDRHFGSYMSLTSTSAPARSC
jgi:hypothetical protein